MSIDLSQLVGGKQFLVPSIISYNGYGIKLKALADSGANGFCFVNSTIALQLAKYLRIKKTRLDQPIPVKGFDGRQSDPVTDVLMAHLSVDGRRTYNIPLLITNLGTHDLILGRKFFQYYNIWLNVRDRALIWPEDRPQTPSFVKNILTTIPDLKRPAIPLPHDQEPPVKGPQKLDIALIGAIGFSRSLKDPQTQVYTTSLYEIDHILEEKALDSELMDKQLIQRNLPAEHCHYTDVFSKAASDQLPPHRPYDHQIELTGPNTLGYSPLRNQTAEELEATKRYLTENLDKGFIEPSQAPFQAPILFVKKANGSLRFCIDFRKLNDITRKDRYPLPLIDETLAQIQSAKIFTKLDIRQAFHRLRIHPDS
jgi:hypothetical protein